MAGEIDPVKAAKALAHPMRPKILALLDGESRSPKALASKLGEPLANVSYHVSVLDELGAIEPTGTRPRRGAIEHFYTARWRIELAAELIDKR